MENQHRQIKGYRELDQTEIDAMNEVKQLGADVGALIDRLSNVTGERAADGRWLAIARTQLQQGFMALTRSIAKPDFF